MEILNNTSLDKVSMVTGDVEALYPNININDLLLIFLNNSTIRHLEPLTRFITRNNFLQYANRIYLQLTGIAMGSNAAVALAEIYMYFTYDLIINNLMDDRLSKVMYFKRYIDDYFVMLKNCDLQEFNKITNSLPKNLQLTGKSLQLPSIF